MAPRTRRPNDIVNKTHPRRPHIILRTLRVPPHGRSTSINTVTLSFTTAAKHVPLLPRLSSTDTFGDLDYSDPHAIRRHLAEIHRQIDQLKTLQELREKRIAELENEFIDVLQLVAEVRSLRDSLRERLEALQERGPPAPAAEGDPCVGAPAVEGASSASGSIRARSSAQFPSPASPIDATSTTQAPPEVVDTMQPETRPSNGTLKKLARMLALKRIRKSIARVFA